MYSETRLKMRVPIKCPLCNREVTVNEMTVVRDKYTEVLGKWGSKIDKILEIIQGILNDQDADPASKKILIYSQWEDSLTVLGHVLT